MRLDRCHFAKKNTSPWMTLAVACALALAAGCSDDDNPGNDNVDAGTCTPDATFAEPMVPDPYPAVIITSEDLAEAFQALATFHTQTGTPTRVVTIEEICDATPCEDASPIRDTAKAIKDYLMNQPGLSYAILGGDIEVVPSRLTDDQYENTIAGVFDEVFYSDYYFADFSQWDTDHDGQYGEFDDDVPDYRPDIAVSRIPASTVEEVERYTQKVIAYCSAYNPLHVERAVLLANVATRIGTAAVNSARYFEADGRTLDLLPEGFHVSKLYYHEDSPDPTAQDVTVANQIAAIENGANLIVHNGHAYPSLLTTEQDGEAAYAFDGARAYLLQNTTYPIFLSGGCQAGQFEAPFVWHGQTFNEDAAGEQLVNAPNGGAVAYLGNTTTGLGLAGGSQFIDEMLREMDDQAELRLADALLAAHERLPDTDFFDFPLGGQVQVVDPDSWRWTQKAVVLLGDGLIPVWNAPREAAPTIEVTRTEICGGATLEIQVDDPTVPTVYVGHGADVYRVDLTSGAGSIQVATTGPDDSMTVAAPASDTFFLYQQALAAPSE